MAYPWKDNVHIFHLAPSFFKSSHRFSFDDFLKKLASCGTIKKSRNISSSIVLYFSGLIFHFLPSECCLDLKEPLTALSYQRLVCVKAIHSHYYDGLKFTCIDFSSQQQKRRKALCIQTDLFLSFLITQLSFPINGYV